MRPETLAAKPPAQSFGRALLFLLLAHDRLARLFGRAFLFLVFLLINKKEMTRGPRPLVV
jgi:hypothetical protein